ncbi:MAG: CoxG family protein [Micromonosporaceae bacterium]
MQLTSTFHVPVDSDTAFSAFLDPDTMRSCIPGCAELSREDENTYRGRLANKVAHVRFNAKFVAELVSVDQPHSITAVLRGEDHKLASSLKINADLRIAPQGDGSDITYTMDMALWGKVGRLGEAIFRRRTQEVERQFVRSFIAACVPAEAPAGAPAAAAAATGGTSPQPSAAASRQSDVAAKAHTSPATRTPGRWRRAFQRIAAFFRGGKP